MCFYNITIHELIQINNKIFKYINNMRLVFSCANLTNILLSKNAVYFGPNSSVFSLQWLGGLMTLNLLNWLVKAICESKQHLYRSVLALRVPGD
jgi:hypothetical protein